MRILITLSLLLMACDSSKLVTKNEYCSTPSSIFEGVDSHHVCANLEQHRTTRGVNQGVNQVLLMMQL